MQIKNGVCLLCIFALYAVACRLLLPLHHASRGKIPFRVILLLIIGLLVMSVLALIAFIRYKWMRSKHQHHEEMNRMMALKMENMCAIVSLASFCI